MKKISKIAILVFVLLMFNNSSNIFKAQQIEEEIRVEPVDKLCGIPGVGSITSTVTTPTEIQEFTYDTMIFSGRDYKTYYFQFQGFTPTGSVIYTLDGEPTAGEGPKSYDIGASVFNADPDTMFAYRAIGSYNGSNVINGITYYYVTPSYVLQDISKFTINSCPW